MFDGNPTIIVERFDRYRDKRDGLIKRIHQEDCCQALGVHPSRKYQSDGGPGIPEIMDLLRFTKAPDIDRDRFMRAQAFNWAIIRLTNPTDWPIFSLRNERELCRVRPECSPLPR